MKLVSTTEGVQPPSQEVRQARRDGVKFGAWVSSQLRTAQQVEKFRQSLTPLCLATTDNRELGALILAFPAEDVVTTIRVVFGDEQSEADMVITNMTTLKSGEREGAVNRGFGSRALKTLLAWAHEQGLCHIVATQVRAQAESFWERHGFLSLGNICNDFRYRL
jgi:GNAT superfamily N-acetyltransferase